MSEQKPARPRLMPYPGPAHLGETETGEKGGQDKAVRPLRYEPPGVKTTMRSAVQTRTDPQSRRARGRLSRETLNKLGKVLEAYFDDVRNQGVPDRFKDLLRQYDRKEDSSRENAREEYDKGSS